MRSNETKTMYFENALGSNTKAVLGNHSIVLCAECCSSGLSMGLSDEHTKPRVNGLDLALFDKHSTNLEIS